jgi:hypothetical protein
MPEVHLPAAALDAKQLLGADVRQVEEVNLDVLHANGDGDLGEGRGLQQLCNKVTVDSRCDKGKTSV